MKKITIGILTIAILFAQFPFTAPAKAQKVPVKKPNYEETLNSVKNKLEKYNTTVSDPAEFIPNDIHMFMEIDLSDKTQADFINKKLSELIKMTQEPENPESANMIKYFVQTLTLDNHIYNAYKLKTDQNNKLSVDIYLTFKTQNEQLDLLLTQLEKFDASAEAAYLNEIPYYKIKLTDKIPQTDIYVTKINNVAIITNNLDSLQISINTQTNNENSLYKYEKLTNLKQELITPYLFGLYFDAANIYSLIENYVKTENPALNTPEFNMLKLMETVYFRVQSKGNEIISNTYSQLIAEKVDEKELNFEDYIIKNSLKNRFPNAKPFFFTETANPSELINKISIKQLKELNEEEYNKFQEELKQKTELNLEEDILSWTKNEFAMAIQDSGNLIPAATIMANTGTNTENAKIFTEKIDKLFENFIKELKQTAPSEAHANTISKTEFTYNNAIFHKIIIDLESILTLIAEEENKNGHGYIYNDIQAIKDNFAPIEITYGVTSDNIFIISTYPDLVANLNEDLSRDPEFKQALERVELGNSDLTYLNSRAILDHGTYIFQTLPKLNTELYAEENFLMATRIYYGAQNFLYKFKNILSTQTNNAYNLENLSSILTDETAPKTNFINEIENLKNSDCDNDGISDYEEILIDKTSPCSKENSEKSTYNTFDDVSTNSWYSRAVSTLERKNIIQGTITENNNKTSKLFRPGASATRAEFTKMVVEAFDIPFYYPYSFNFENQPVNSGITFNDIHPQDWFFQYIYSAANAGIVSGYQDKNFKPGDQITRAEALAILIKASKLSCENPEKQHKFLDINNHWGENYISCAYNNGIIQGINAYTFAPNQEITRAEAAIMIYKTMAINTENKLKKNGFQTFKEQLENTFNPLLPIFMMSRI